MRHKSIAALAAATLLLSGACAAESSSAVVETDDVDAREGGFDVIVIDNDDDEPEDGDDETGEEADFPEITAPIDPVIDVPGGFSQIGEENRDILGFEYTATALQLDGASSGERIYITSYLLPDQVAASSYPERLNIVREYDDLTNTESADHNHSLALTNGEQGVFRFIQTRDSRNQHLQQRNTFVFKGPVMVQVTCQWQEERAAIHDACHDVQKSLEIPLQ
ncbi:hypothetical protein [Natronoglycomyces albus]|uniref:Uncharacterized protein n=1 Tax=Natronoglycomyces albus TaxID=2811108 RepID=A0A895XIA0_9ACTN|nr:hypothetical protein [Natronoglycomyces albus]QSB05064.1 hypothetical protein JQS30_15095 [Natronoglycomyces albus]